MKTLLKISIPAIVAEFDVLVPAFLRIKSIITLIADACENLTGSAYVCSGEERLCSVEKNMVLKSESTLERYGVTNGEHLMII